jgi:hypothetical protein
MIADFDYVELGLSLSPILKFSNNRNIFKGKSISYQLLTQDLISKVSRKLA